MLRILKDLDISSFIASLRIFWFYSHTVKSFYSGQFNSQLCQQTTFLVSLTQHLHNSNVDGQLCINYLTNAKQHCHLEKKTCHCFMDRAVSIVEINQTVLFTKRYKVNTSERAQQDKTLNSTAHNTFINPFPMDSSQCKKKITKFQISFCEVQRNEQHQPKV